MDAEAVVGSWALASMFLSVKWESEKLLPHSAVGRLGSRPSPMLVVSHGTLTLLSHPIPHAFSLGLILETDQRVWTHLHKTPASLRHWLELCLSSKPTLMSVFLLKAGTFPMQAK